MSGALAFESHYAELYGARWPALKLALLGEKKHAVVLDPKEEIPESFQILQPIAWYPNAWLLPEKITLPGVRAYFMDAASMLPVKALELQQGEKVLDLCAAPGGKSLLMAWLLGPRGILVSNDRSPDRRGRLKKTLDELTLPETRPNFRITGFDAGGWGLHEKNLYDKVLLDAPCSSERHVLEDPKELKVWSPKRPKRLATDQFTMLCAALEAVKPGGVIVYSTCALETRENDGVVARLLERRAGRVELFPWVSPLGEKTEFGTQVLPDQDGFGPFYLCRLKKLEAP